MTGTIYRCEWRGKAVGANKRLARITKSGEYQNFVRQLAWWFAVKRQETFRDAVRVDLRVCVDKRRDVDSLVKPVLDALEQARVYIDDKQVRRLTVEKTDKGRGEPDWITVEVRENEV